MRKKTEDTGQDIVSDAAATTPEHPSEGGSYVRNEDGSLTRVEFTAHGDEPVAPAEPDASTPPAGEPEE